MTKKSFIKFLGLLLVVGLLFAAAPVGQAQAASVVMTEAQLTAALADTSVTEIELGANIALTSTAYVTRDGVSIDGKNFTITGPSVYHGIDVSGDNVTIKNLTITAAAKSNLQFYRVTGGIVTDVVLSNAGNAGMIVNGSVVTISNVTTSGNAWGGINVDQGSGVTEVPLLTVTNVTHHTSPAGSLTPAIWVDTGNAAWVSAAGLYIVRPGTPLAFFDIAEFTEAFPVHNVTQDTYFSTIQAAIAAAVAGDTINVAPGEYVEVGQIVIDKNLTIVGADKSTTIIKPAQNTGASADARGWWLVNVGVQFNLSNVTLDGAGKLVSIGILSHGTGTIENNIIKNIGYNPSGPDYAGRGIAIYDADMTIKNNLLQNIGRIGIYVYGADADQVVIDGNTYEGKGIGDWLDYGIEIEGGADAEVKHNLIKNCTGVASVDGSGSAGLLITTYFASGSTANIHDNEFNGNSVGIAVGYSASDTSSVVVEYNKLLNNDYAITTTAPEVDGSPNWFGTLAGPQPGILDGDVVYNPWCADAACTEFLPAAVTIAPVAPVVCGNTPTTTIEINVAGIPTSAPLQGYQFRLHFDETKTSIANLATDIVNGGFVANGGFLVVNYIDETTGAIVTGPTGLIDVAYTQFTPSTSIGNGKLASVKLTHLGIAGDIALSLTDVLLSDRDGFPIPSEASATATTLSLTPAVKNVTKNLGYCTLAEAVAGAAASGDVLQLQADIAIPATVTVDKALTLDLNGKVATYSTTDNSYALVVDGTAAALTVVDGITPSTGKILVVDADEDGVTDGRGIGVISGSLILESGTIQAPYAGVYVRPGTSMVMNGGTIGGTVDPLYGIAILGTGSSLDINGGVIEATYFAVTGNGTAGFGETTITIDGGILTSTTAAAIYHPQDGNLTITAGTISGINGIEMKAGNLVVTGGTILGTGAYADPVANDNGSVETGDAILLNGRDAYTGDITVNITGGIITSTNAYALRDYKAADQALKTSAVLVSGGTFSGGIQAVTFSDEFVALPRTATTGLMLTGGLYNTDPAYPDVFVFVPYGTILDGSMYRIVGISLNVHDFYYANYDTGHGILRGVSTDFYATNFVFADATSVTVQLFSGTEGAYVLQQTNTLKNPLNHPGDVLTSSFDIFGTYVSNSWTNVKVLPEYGQHVPPTRVLVTVVLPGGTLTGENLTPDFEYSLIDPVLVAEDFAYMAQSDVRGVTAGFHPVNFTLDQVLTLKVELFAGTQLLQTNISPVPSVHGVALLQQFSGPFDIFGTFDYEHDFASDGVTPYWNNTRELEYGQTLVPTRVLATVTLPGGVTRTVENVLLTGDRTSILPGVNGLITLQGILTPKAGVPVRLTSGSVVRDTLSTALSDINYGFTGVETLTYTFTTHQPRYLNVTADSGKTFLVNGDKVLNSLRLYGGDVDQNNAIGLSDASTVGSDWGSTLNPESNINYDGIVNIQDLALVGGNYGLTSADAYGWWFILP